MKQKVFSVVNAENSEKMSQIKGIPDGRWLAFQINDSKTVFSVEDQFWGYPPPPPSDEKE